MTNETEQSLGFGLVQTSAWGFTDPAWGAKCASCGQWLTKYDHTKGAARASAQDALTRHRCEGRYPIPQPKVET